MIGFNNNPKIEVPPSQQDLLLLKIGWGLVAFNFLLILAFYFYLPNTIPVHFDLKGEPDGFGDKSGIWLLPIINLALFYGLTLLIKKIKPWHFNYPVDVTIGNAPVIYRLNLKMLTQLNLVITLIFVLLSLETIRIAFDFLTSGLMYMLLILILFSIALPFYYIFKMFKLHNL